MLTLLGFTFGLFEIIFFSGFFLLLLVGISFDRNGRENPKWYIFGIGMIVIAAWFWKDWTFSGLFDTVRAWSFWEPILAYLAAGIVYAVIEFVFDIRRSARKYKAAWEDFLTQTIRLSITNDRIIHKEELSLKEVLDRATGTDDAKDSVASDAAKEAVSRFVDRNSDRKSVV